MGRNPSEIITLLSQNFLSSSSSTNVGQNIKLRDILDQCIEAPTNFVRKEIIYLLKVGFSCLRSDPCTRPTMQEVSKELALSIQDTADFAKPFESITLGDILLS
ncbi:hypothetical protein MKX03_006650 [Papaver bracteatum]|nr:hypothetical protein MKX03_006650 [Papaver bracteatum]